VSRPRSGLFDDEHGHRFAVCSFIDACSDHAEHPSRAERDRVAGPPVRQRGLERRRVGRCADLVFEPELECSFGSPFR
jgi:hypothetical protein